MSRPFFDDETKSEDVHQPLGRLFKEEDKEISHREAVKENLWDIHFSEYGRFV